MYEDIYNKLSIKLDDIEAYLPNINFDFIERKEIDDFFVKNKYKKIVLLSNNNPLTIRIELDINEVVNRLSEIYTDVLFILTNKSNIKKTNVVHVKDILDVDCDFNEISYLSTYCDVIVGKPSGPYVFTMIDKNLLDINKTFITISDNIYDGFYLESNAKMLLLKEHSIDSLYDMIKNNIE